MKIKIISLLLALLMLTACGTEVSAPVSAPAPEEAPQTFGEAPVADTPVQMAETTAMPSAAQEPEAEAPQGAPLAPAETMEGETEWEPLQAQLTALILCKESDGLSYAPEDPIAMLRGLGYLVGLMEGHDNRIQVSGSAAIITPAMAEEYVKVLFDGFSGQFPGVTEEDPLVKKNGKNYEINLVELGDLSLDCAPIVEEADGTMTVTASLTLDGRSLPTYSFTLDFSDSGHFSYVVCSMTRAPGT